MSNLGACNCCEEPPCAAPELEFISVSASCTVCGYALPAHEDLGEGEDCLRFKKRTDRRIDLIVISTSDAGSTYDYNSTTDQSGIREKYVTEAGACAERIVSGQYDRTVIELQTVDSETTVDKTTTETASAGPSGIFSGTFSIVDAVGDGDDSGAFSDATMIGTYSPSNSWTYTPSETAPKFEITEGDLETGQQTSSVTFSEPITACEPDLPAWPAWYGESEDALLTGQGYASSALRSAGGTCGLTLTLRSVKWRVKHQPSGTCYLKAWIRKTFTPAATVPPTDPLPAPTVTNTTYEWIGTGNPCLADPALAVDHADNLIKGSATEETAPETAGVTTFEILKFSCVEGYEPDISDTENPQPNGFPDPTWEAAAP